MKRITIFIFFTVEARSSGSEAAAVRAEIASGEVEGDDGRDSVARGTNAGGLCEDSQDAAGLGENKINVLHVIC